MKRDYIEFQDHSKPLAYLITIRCYGTWLHGDERGSMNRRAFNVYGTPKISPKPGLKNSDTSRLKSLPIKLGIKERKIVEEAIKEVCSYRGYALIAVNARTNHVHIVVSANIKPEPIMNSFKSYATRKLRKESLRQTVKIWSRHGSTKYLWTEENINAAVDYVQYSQGDDAFELS